MHDANRLELAAKAYTTDYEQEGFQCGPLLYFPDFCAIVRSLSTPYDDPISNVRHELACRIQMMLSERIRRPRFICNSRAKWSYVPKSCAELAEMLREHGLLRDENDQLRAEVFWADFEAARDNLRYNRTKRARDEIAELGRVLSCS